MMDHSLRERWDENYFDYGKEHLVVLEPYMTSGYAIKTGLGQALGKAIGQMPQSGTPGAATVALEPGNDGASQKMLRTGSDNYSMIMAGLALGNCGVLRLDHH